MDSDQWLSQAYVRDWVDQQPVYNREQTDALTHDFANDHSATVALSDPRYPQFPIYLQYQVQTHQSPTAMSVTATTNTEAWLARDHAFAGVEMFFPEHYACENFAQGDLQPPQMGDHFDAFEQVEPFLLPYATSLGSSVNSTYTGWAASTDDTQDPGSPTSCSDQLLTSTLPTRLFFPPTTSIWPVSQTSYGHGHDNTLTSAPFQGFPRHGLPSHAFIHGGHHYSETELLTTQFGASISPPPDEAQGISHLDAINSVLDKSSYIHEQDIPASTKTANLGLQPVMTPARQSPHRMKIEPAPRAPRRPPPRFACTLCETTCRGAPELDRHVRFVHSPAKAWRCVNDPARPRYHVPGCQACARGKTYPRADNAASHLRRVHCHPKNPDGGNQNRGGSSGGCDPPLHALKGQGLLVEVDLAVPGRVGGGGLLGA